MNKIFKSKYEYTKRKISGYDNDNKKVNVIENKIDSLKKKNLLIKKEINDIRIDKLKHKKEYELISDNKKFSLKIKLKTEEMNNFSAQKQLKLFYDKQVEEKKAKKEYERQVDLAQGRIWKHN